ncbi:hypothetical protein BCE33L2983 [Bacillus cereus E33L]|uniref:Uncharacterized protein n=1 Tax=Bacillus cereus (strain ZK / E33L) TaxID=288681 RepID=Q638U7_BACCZ|nr:hypothetical protein BCE33L2983 [Bacillus cereus E33L]
MFSSHSSGVISSPSKYIPSAEYRVYSRFSSSFFGLLPFRYQYEKSFPNKTHFNVKGYIYIIARM